jgi:hypothetical protein
VPAGAVDVYVKYWQGESVYVEGRAPMQVMMDLPDDALRGVFSFLEPGVGAAVRRAEATLAESRALCAAWSDGGISKYPGQDDYEDLQSKYVACYGAMGDAIARIAPHLEAVTQFQLVSSRCDGAMKRTANVLTTLCRACREERGYVEIRSKQAQLAYVLRLREQNYSGEIYLHSLGGGGGRWFTLNPRSDSEDEGSVNY